MRAGARDSAQWKQNVKALCAYWDKGPQERIPIFGYFRVLKEYPQKSQIWQIDTNPNQGIPNQVP